MKPNILIVNDDGIQSPGMTAQAMMVLVQLRCCSGSRAKRKKSFNHIK